MDPAGVAGGGAGPWELPVVGKRVAGLAAQDGMRGPAVVDLGGGDQEVGDLSLRQVDRHLEQGAPLRIPDLHAAIVVTIVRWRTGAGWGSRTWRSCSGTPSARSPSGRRPR